MSTSAKEVAHVVSSNSFAKPREIREAEEWGKRYHPDKDLAELLFMRGVIDRSKVSLIRKMAKMSRSTSSRRPTEVLEDGDSTPPVVSVRELRARPPEQIGKYKILEKVAQGGMGVIYKARHVDLDRVFALKILAPRGQASKEATTRFEREAKTAARLDHPHIVRVYDAGVAQDAPYLVMDFVNGPDLGALIKAEGLGLKKAAQVARAIALALHYAHEQNVVHRDVKPGNIIIDGASGEPKITDFGIVKELTGESEDSRLTQTGYTLGSPCYMSPEQAEGRHTVVGPQSDVYSLGATLYEMLTEQPPHDGESIHEIMSRVVADDPLPVRHRNPAVPQDLEVVCMKALEKELDRRYATAREFAEDLGRFLDEEPVLAKPAGLATKAWRGIRRHKTVSALLVAFVLLAGAGLGSVWRWQRQLELEARQQRDDRLARAEELLAVAAASEDPREKEHAYYTALQELQMVLGHEPQNDRARGGKRRAVLALGDHLIETGDARFAEFVFTLGAGVADPAEISSRIETARLGQWVEKAEQAELGGDREQAIELYKNGLRSLQEAGYGGARLQARIEDLEDVQREQRQREEAQKIVRLAQTSASKGDHVGALLAYKRAQKLAPDDRDLASQVAYHQKKAQGQASRLSREAKDARARVEAALEELGDEFEEHRAAADVLLGRGDAAALSAQDALDADAFARSFEALRAARKEFDDAYALTNAVRLRGRSRAEAKQAEERGASRFAPTELGLAKDLQYKGDQAFARKAYLEASQDYARAAAAFRRAARTGSSKGAVADAREAALSARAGAITSSRKDQRTDAFKLAEAEFQRAERHYDAREYEPASKLYANAEAAFDLFAQQAPRIVEAFAARSRVRALRGEASRYLAREFASEEFSRARQAELSGDQALADDRAEDSIQAYGEAVYRYKRSAAKSKPHAEAKREYDVLSLAVNDARQYCVDNKLEWKANFKRAEERLRQAEEALSRRYWNGAKRHLERALKLYQSLHK